MVARCPSLRRTATLSLTQPTRRATIKALPTQLRRPRPYGYLGLLPLSRLRLMPVGQPLRWRVWLSCKESLMTALVPILLFIIGVILAIWATERLLEGLVSLAAALRLSAFAIGAILS